jgi:hypothetical protein
MTEEDMHPQGGKASASSLQQTEIRKAKAEAYRILRKLDKRRARDVWLQVRQVERLAATGIWGNWKP